MSRASSSSLKEKEKEIQKKGNIKSRKIDKRKILVSEAFHNTLPKSPWSTTKSKSFKTGQN